MTYIKLEDVQKILDTDENKYIYWETAIIEIEKQINSLPSINPEEMIESNKIQDGYTTGNTRDFEKGYNQALQELLQKFKS